ncbi:helix-turn-helix domain-containing protein [Streptomyces hydrogenans]|uniref:helix-turn-helix domain-containing protein n=1 Tax=Streptomyces hydrogenans TaxID=1873719 RepID=UPI0035D9E79F
MSSKDVPSTWSGVDIAVPTASHRLPGVSMAGFRQVLPAPVDIAMVAHPSVTLLIDLSGDDGLVYETGVRRGRGSVVIGMAPGELRASGLVGECLQIRLEPAAAAAVLGSPVEAGAGAESLADLWGRDAGRVEERLRTAGSWDERFAMAADLVRGRIGDGGPRVDPEVAYTWRRMAEGGGRVRIDGLADEVGWSRKRLWARFRAQLGLTPKRAARLVRFDHAAHLLAAGLPPAGVAAESGFVDQSHLHRETKAFTGLTPAAVAAAPWLAIDDIAWPDLWRAGRPVAGTQAGSGRR